MNTSTNQSFFSTTNGSVQASTRFVRYGRCRLLDGLRVLPVAMMLVGAASFAPAAGATGCHQPVNLAVSGGTIRNTTTLALSADGGIAVSNANGGDDTIAVAGNGGLFGDGGNALAGNGGLANANAAGGMIDLDDVRSGGNRGNAIAASGLSGCGSAPRSLAIDGGTVSNETTLNLSADGGIAVSNANGGDDTIAVAGNGGLFGDGGNALAGNGGLAISDARGGTISIGDVNSGNNRGNAIVVGLGGWFGERSTARINGGTVRNRTILNLSADGGTAISDANGGDDNIAVAGNGGILGDGGSAAAGNGGVAVSDASGGAISLGDINSGGNSGNTIAVSGGGNGGSLVIDGGTVTNETTIAISADGGTAVSNADGGDDNIAVAGNGGEAGDGGAAAAGNGGVAVSDASGGNISLGDINSGGNSGNTIVIGS